MEHKEKYEILFDKVKQLFDEHEIIFHAVNRKGIVLTALYYGEKEFISWEDIFYNAIEFDKELKAE